MIDSNQIRVGVNVVLCTDVLTANNISPVTHQQQNTSLACCAVAMAAISSITGDRLHAATVRGSSDAGEAERQDAL